MADQGSQNATSTGLRRGLYAAAAAACLAVPASAQTIELRNDSLENGSEANICPCFEQGEEAAVWLTSPCDGAIVEIQVFWASYDWAVFGTPAQIALEDALVVRQAGTFPVPGPIITELLGPALQDGGLNVFATVDDDQTIPLNVPVSAGQEFVLSIRFDSSAPGPLSPALFGHPTVVSDNDGCQNGKNAIFNNNVGAWQNACNIPGVGGISGDWVIRALVECSGEPVGACCLPDGSCITTTEGACAAASGFFNGNGTTCTTSSCLGACFVPATGNCLADFQKSTCDLVGGTWQGPGTTDCTPACPVDIGGPGGVGPDGQLDLFDLLVFFELFVAADPRADVGTTGSDQPGPDGGFDIFDIIYYLTQYGMGC